MSSPKALASASFMSDSSVMCRRVSISKCPRVAGSISSLGKWVRSQPPCSLMTAGVN